MISSLVIGLFNFQAHTTFVCGKNGGGIAEVYGIEDQIDICVGTLSKAVGCLGGFITCSKNWKKLIQAKGRPYIFSTASPLPVVAGCCGSSPSISPPPSWFIDGVVSTAEWQRSNLFWCGNAAAVMVAKKESWRREAVWRRVQEFSAMTGIRASSPIVSLVVGTEAAALHASKHMMDRGFHLTAIRPPAVAPDACRLRLTLTAAHTTEDIRRLVAALSVCIHSLPVTTDHIAAGLQTPKLWTWSKTPLKKSSQAFSRFPLPRLAGSSLSEMNLWLWNKWKFFVCSSALKGPRCDESTDPSGHLPRLYGACTDLLAQRCATTDPGCACQLRPRDRDGPESRVLRAKTLSNPYSWIYLKPLITRDRMPRGSIFNMSGAAGAIYSYVEPLPVEEHSLCLIRARRRTRRRHVSASLQYGHRASIHQWGAQRSTAPLVISTCGPNRWGFTINEKLGDNVRPCGRLEARWS